MTAESCLAKHIHCQEPKRSAYTVVVAFNINNRAGKTVIMRLVQGKGRILRVFCSIQRCFDIQRNFFAGFIHPTDIQENAIQTNTEPNAQ